MSPFVVGVAAVMAFLMASGAVESAKRQRGWAYLAFIAGAMVFAVIASSAAAR